ncbi:MAG: transposase, partial [Planctomycetes bacterium]|nr:transposase [Planctomycetota bacterium]
ENRKTDGIIPPQSETKKPRRIPLRRFRYDSRHKIVRCPAGKVLKRSRREPRRWIYRAKACDCRDCSLRSRCVPPSGKVRTIGISDGYEALLRARRRKAKGWDEQTRQLYRRHRWRSEGIHGEAKKWHGLVRAIRRGLWNVAIQAYLTAAVMNLKRLAGLGSIPRAAAVGAKVLIGRLFSILHCLNCCQASDLTIGNVQWPGRRDLGRRTQFTAKAA